MKTKLLFGLFLIATLQFTNAQAGHTIGLVGDFNGWSTPDATLSTTDDINYTLKGWTLATDSEIKFRQDESWAGTAWGTPASGSSWPSAMGDTAGGNISALAGTYDVTFNVTTGAYMFSTQTISLIGDFNSWGGDVDLISTDNVNYTLSGWVLAADGEIKFRHNHEWVIAWGAPTTGSSWPSGIGSTAGGGANIDALAGTYDVTFNFTTGAYSFTENNLAVGDFTKNIQFYYVNNTLNISGYNGKASIKAFDLMGRLLYNKDNLNIQNGFSQSIALPKNQVSFILIKGEGFTKSLKVIAHE